MKRENQATEFFDIFIRYFILALASLSGLWVFYFIFTPLTILPVKFILGLFYDVSLYGNLMIVNGLGVEFIKACIAGSAYFLLLILNLSTRGINLKRRISIILISFISLLVLNILRIWILVFIFFNGFGVFDLAHEFFWYFMSTLFVVGIWFAQVKYFKIKAIPFYSDLAYLVRKIKE